MSNNTRCIDFDVSVCLGYGDGGDVCVSVDVSDKEYELLKECCLEDDEIDGYPGLEDLCKRIKGEAQCECDFCMSDYDSEEEIDYRRVSYIIRTPSEIYYEVFPDEDEEE